MLNIITKSVVQSSWEEIKATIRDGNTEWLHSGDMIPVTLKNGEELVLDVARDESGKIIFVFHDCLNEAHVMNKRATNKGGWAKTEMRRYANDEVFALLPDDLQAVIEPTTIVQIVDGKRVETSDKLFCLSRTQVFGKGWWSENEPEDMQLDIFKSERARVKECGDNGTWPWWLRSAYYTNYFSYVHSSGNSNNYSAYNSYGVALGFSL